jgi:hypothetical protein
MADDLVLNVRQISQYPLQQSIAPPSQFLFQAGIGQPYQSVYGYNLVGTALASGSTDLHIAPNFGIAWNGARLWWDLGSFQFSDQVEAPQFFQGGEIVATLAQLEILAASTVSSFNGRVGNVLLEEPDILRAGGLLQNNPHLHGWATSDTPRDIATNDDSIATCLWVQRLICFALDQTVTSFNGRAGDVTLTTADINAAFAVPGPPWPSASNPALGDASNRIATTLFVDDSLVDLEQRILNEIAPPPNLSLYALLASPSFSGVPTAPTATAGSATGQIATTAFVANAIVASTTGVSSFNTRTGAVVLTTTDITNAGGALLASPALTGNPTAPTAAPGDSDTSIATTAFVHAAITAIAAGVSSFNTRTGAVVLTTADVTGVGGAPIASPTFTGVPLAPTAAPATNTTQIATTAYVTAAVAALPAPVTSFNGRVGAVSFQANDISAVGGALLASPIFTGTPQAPTPTAGTNNADIATTAFVAAALTAAGGVASFNGRAGVVTLTLADVTGVGGAPIANPTFTGVPAAATATTGTNTTQLATTAFVQAALAAAPGGVSSFNSRTGAITFLAADISAVGGALLTGPAFSGNPTAPTQAPATSNTTLATTAFVANAIATSGGVSTFNGRAGAVTLSVADLTGIAGALLTVADTAPTGAPASANHALWWDSVGGQLYLSFNDGSSTQWVATNAVGAVAPPTRTVLLSGSGTYTTPAGATWLNVEMVGGGAGGAGGQARGNQASGAGTASTFGTLTAGGGAAVAGTAGSPGGTATGGDINIGGAAGINGASTNSTGSIYGMGGPGGSAYFGGAGGIIYASNGLDAAPNSGSGGGGGGLNYPQAGTGGCGGGAGAYLRKLISTPAASYAYSVGAGGASGAAGTGGWVGGNGGSGIIIVTAHFGAG